MTGRASDVPGEVPVSKGRCEVNGERIEALYR